MGFFSSIKRGFTNAKRAVCRAAGKAIEKIGKITGNVDIEIKGWEIQCNNPVLEKQVDVDDINTSVEDTINVHKLCEETRLQVAKQAKVYEDKVVDQLEDDVNQFIDALAEVFPEEVLREFDYGINDAFEDEIHGTISDYIAKNVSQDSEEFVAILKMDDYIRSEETDKYIKKVLEKAVQTLQTKATNKKLAIYKKMYDDLEAFFENEKKFASEAKHNLEEIKKHKDDISFCETKAIDYVCNIAYMECIKTLTYKNV